MEKEITETPARRQAQERWLFGLGFVVFLLGLLGYGVQFALKRLEVPWYTPALGALGIAMVVVAFWRWQTVPRLLGLVVLTLLFAGELYFLLALSRLPAYAGPAQVGQPLPAFTTLRADGRPFTEKDLQQGKSTVLLFFRGRW